MSPRAFRNCAVSFGTALALQISVLESIGTNRLVRSLLSGSPHEAYRHPRKDLEKLADQVRELEYFLDDVARRFSVVSEEELRRSISATKQFVAKGAANISTKMANVTEAAYRTLVRKRTERIEQSLFGVRTNVIAGVDDCHGLARVYDTAFSLVCDNIVMNLNGIWVALVLIALLFNCTTYTSLRLAEYLCLGKEDFLSSSPSAQSLRARSFQDSNVNGGGPESIPNRFGGTFVTTTLTRNVKIQVGAPPTEPDPPGTLASSETVGGVRDLALEAFRPGQPDLALQSDPNVSLRLRVCDIVPDPEFKT